MGCVRLVHGYRATELTSTGKRPFTLNPSRSDGTPSIIPCGYCIGCLIDRTRHWAARCVHEASLYKNNCFITLTYNKESLPEHGTLVLEDHQKFLKRLRKYLYPNRVRYFHCGEYGSRFQRPHYHDLLFGCDFPDRKLISQRHGFSNFTSEILQSLWCHPKTDRPIGNVIVSDLTYQSAAYVARYVTKKIFGPGADSHYEIIDPETWEKVGDRRKEYVSMSRRPGIASDWFEKFHTDIYPKDYFHLDGKKLRPSKFYDRLFELRDPETFELIREQRNSNLKKYAKDNTYERLRDKEACLWARVDRFKRNYDDGT